MNYLRAAEGLAPLTEVQVALIAVNGCPGKHVNTKNVLYVLHARFVALQTELHLTGTALETLETLVILAILVITAINEIIETANPCAIDQTLEAWPMPHIHYLWKDAIVCIRAP